MPSIYVTALITTVLGVAVYALLMRKFKNRARARLLIVCFLVALPLQPLVFYLIRLPLDHQLASLLGPDAGILQWARTFYAPVTEELAKAALLLLPLVRRDIKKSTFIAYALTIGMAFGLGELWFVAHRIAVDSAYASLPFWQFGGFLSERLMVLLFHTAFVAITLWYFTRKHLWLGLLGAMALHYAGNFPIFLADIYFLNLSTQTWSVIVSLWTVIYFFGMAGLLARLRYGRFSATRFIGGQAVCPNCHRLYDPPFWALNMGPRRFERCPHCGDWHWTSVLTKHRH